MMATLAFNELMQSKFLHNIAFIPKLWLTKVIWTVFEDYYVLFYSKFFCTEIVFPDKVYNSVEKYLLKVYKNSTKETLMKLLFIFFNRQGCFIIYIINLTFTFSSSAFSLEIMEPLACSCILCCFALFATFSNRLIRLSIVSSRISFCSNNCSLMVIEMVKRQWRRSSAFIINFKHISHLFLVFLLLTLNK